MDSIEFFFDGKLQKLKLDKYPPTTTVLKFLRSLPGRQGTKEGCAEGDCGACTVVLAELDGEKLVYRAVNSCLIFLPALHGKWLITVEDLGTVEQPHFIQQAFVEHFASQCGFCTPGFEMALYALLKENPDPSDEEINEAIEGNLCRCTGYRPIRDAAKTIREIKQRDRLTELEPLVISELKKVRKDKPLLFNYGQSLYAVPFTVGQAIDLYNAADNPVYVNGGTDVALRVSKFKEKLQTVIDLGHIDSLKQLRWDGDKLIVGAGVKVQDLKNFVKNKLPEFYELLGNFGAKQIRNRATVAGNVVTASPIGDLIPPLMAMDTVVSITGSKGERTLPLEQFITGYRKTALQGDELVKEFVIRPKKDYKYAFYKISKRTALDITTISLAAAVKTENRKITDIKLVYGGMDAVVRRALEAERFLTGKSLEENNFIQAGRIAAGEFTPISDARADAKARSVLAKNLVLKLYQDLV